MAPTIYPITTSFVAEVGDVDLSKRLTEPALTAIKNAFWKYAVLIFPEQDLTPEQHLAFSECFGPVEADRVLDPKVSPHRLGAAFADISNLASDGKSGRKTAASACTRPAIACGTPTARSNTSRDFARCSIRARLSRWVAIPSSPTSALPTMRYRTR
jgi:hypothetical protein